MRETSYRMNSNFSTNNSTVPRRNIFMNTCILTKRRNRTKKNPNLGTKKTTMQMMITNKMNTRRNSDMISLTGSLIQNLYYP